MSPRPTRATRRDGPPFDLFVFDLDGTLVDSREDIARACNHALAAHGRGTLPSSHVATLVGDGTRALVARAFGLDTASPEVEGPLASFSAFYDAHPADTTTALPGIEELLAWLGPRAKLGVCTNKPRATTERILAALDLASHFSVIYAGGDGPLKPDPSGMLACCKHFGLAAERAALVGDSPQDVLAGRRAGSFTYGVATEIFVPSGALRAASPDVIVESASALHQLLLRA